MLELVNFLNVSYEEQFSTLHWRNSEHVSKYFQIKNIDEKTHRNWLEKLKEQSPKTIAFFIKSNEKLIGVTYFHSIDYEKQEADWGIYIYEESFRGKGIGTKTLSSCLEYAKDTLDINTIFLEVLEHNFAAKAVYEKMGFELLAKNDNILRYRKNIR